MLYRGRCFLKSADSLRKVTPVRHCKSSTQSNLGVVIPKRIERGPTDILKALASTVQQDPTAFPYKYPDDPHFYPYSNSEKRIYALSLESGRKSARWIIEKNPEYFKTQLSDPPIEDFQPKVIYNENSEVTVETLVDLIDKRKVTDAMTVYNLLQKNGTEISNELKQSLLELVCFFNAEDKSDIKELEFKWFGDIEDTKLSIDTWKKNSFADTLFESMDPKCPLANSTIIQGMIKFNCFQRAFEIFNTAKSNNVELSVGVYNALLTQINNTSADIGDGWTFLINILKEMSSKKITPNLGTMNAALKSLAYLNITKKENHLKELLMEFAELGVEPSLGTYYYIFLIFCRSRVNIQDKLYVLKSLLELIGGKNHEIKHPCDFLFFPQTMNLFNLLPKGIDLCHHLHHILLQNDNKKFIVNGMSENSYFRYYLSSVFKKEPLDVAMEKYCEIVPAMYVPEFGIFALILKTMIENEDTESLVRIWSDIKKFKMDKYVGLLSIILPLAKNVTEEAALKVVHEAAVNLQEYWEESRSKQESQDLISSLLFAFLKTGDGKRALEVFAKGKNLKNAYALFKEYAILELMQYAATADKIPIVLECLSYAETEVYTEVIKAAETVLPLLNESDRAWVTQLIEKTKNLDSVEENVE